jgi:outer membrane receptor protein involved in Fe transport
LLDNGETVSEIDLRGLGSNGTLILLDGRRLPSIPTSDRPLSFRQADLNAIPLHAIARVETLTGTAGGIYGFGALGGVVNVILKRDYRGVDLHGTAGITSRGDARRLGLEGRIGFTPNEGRTDVMLYLGHTRSRPLLLGDRDYGLRDRVAINEFAPDVYDTLARIGTYSSNSVGIFTFPQEGILRSNLNLAEVHLVATGHSCHRALRDLRGARLGPQGQSGAARLHLPGGGGEERAWIPCDN